MAQWLKNVILYDGLNLSTHYPYFWNVFFHVTVWGGDHLMAQNGKVKGETLSNSPSWEVEALIHWVFGTVIFGKK